MTNNKKISLVLGIMCFALTVGICIQIKTVKNSNIEVSQSYQESQLRAEVLKYKEKYDNEIKKIEKIDIQLEESIQKATENNKELEETNQKILQGNKLIGLAEVKGPGVIITIKDSDKDISNTINPSYLVVHDQDILNIVNELKNAGAEAISINNQRVVATTSIVCAGNIISINGERIGSPFVIQAIGFPETLANLKRPGGTLSLMEEKPRYLKVSLEKANNIIIPKYSGVFNFKYAKSIE